LRRGQIKLRAAEAGQAPRTFALDQGLERRAQQRVLFLQAGMASAFASNSSSSFRIVRNFTSTIGFASR
jgi:hypothetical protein